jgi:hypothetical protein
MDQIAPMLAMMAASQNNIQTPEMPEIAPAPTVSIPERVDYKATEDTLRQVAKGALAANQLRNKSRRDTLHVSLLDGEDDYGFSRALGK